PFSAMVMEFIGMAEPGMDGVATGNWNAVNDLPHHAKNVWPKTKKELLQRWDDVTEKINRLWPQIPPQRFNENDKAFGQWEGPVYSFIIYWIDNEIHHRGQAYVYLRSLGIEPPAFYDRS
ncbi:MAG TPA: DinB family protein, partial [Chitinophagaceae bacterium]|nr:DinB family protein [Chitinophagaceae bacterium]